VAKRSAGLLAYRFREGSLEVFLVHPGGPFWKKKDAGAWSIPKGELGPAEEPRAAALREFQEETGIALDEGVELLELQPIRQPGGKEVVAFAFEAPELDPAAVQSNTFQIEWPPKSGKRAEFPEIDRAQWFGLEEAAEKIQHGQEGLLDQLAKHLLA
jgi:predicted NUDIX family NTP pyrophosphohydrolase